MWQIQKSTLETTSASQVDTHCVLSGWKDRSVITVVCFVTPSRLFEHLLGNEFSDGGVAGPHGKARSNRWTVGGQVVVAAGGVP